MENSKKPSFTRHKLMNSPIYEVTVRILALTKNYSEVFASGTGVVIAENLVLTAKHVVDDFINKWKVIKSDDQFIAENFNIWVVFISSNTKELYHVYDVAKIYNNPYSDMALLHLDSFDKIGKGKHWKQTKLSLELPKVGERVVAFGFSKSKTEIQINKEGLTEIKVNDEPHTSVGEVIEIYPEKRDIFLLPFPSIRLNLRLDGGMSGGPVFNNEGELIGIVCSSYDQESQDEHISYATLLWPLMGTTLTKKNNTCYPLYDLAKNNVISVRGLDRIIISKTHINSNYEISYRKT